MEIRTTLYFDRRFKKLPKVIKDKAKIREDIFKIDPFDPRLETHKLHGKQKEERSYSINRSYRISFIFLNRNKVLYLNIGTHDELYK